MIRCRGLFLGVLAMCLLMGGCSTVKRSTKQSESRAFRYDDADIKTHVVSAMLKKSAASAGNVNVYAYKGHVFIVGEADDTFRRFVYTTATGTEGVSQVTMHWFNPGTKTPADAELLKTLANRTGVGTTIDPLQASLDVYGGHVVFTGALPTRQDVDKILSLAKGTPGVKKITSYISSER